MRYTISEIKNMDDTDLFIAYSDILIRLVHEANSIRGETKASVNTLTAIRKELADRFGLDIARIQKDIES